MNALIAASRRLRVAGPLPRRNPVRARWCSVRAGANAAFLWKEIVRDVRPPATDLFVNAQVMAMTRAGFEHIREKHVKVAAARCSTLIGARCRHTFCVTVVQS